MHLFLLGYRRREDRLFSTQGPSPGENMASSRRKKRAPTTRWRFLNGWRIPQQEGGIFSSENACSDEKITFSRRRARRPTRRLDFLDGTCVLLREDGRFLVVH